MHSSFVLVVEIVAASVILFRSIQIGSHVTWKQWHGHPLQFIGMTLCYPLLAGGSVGVLLDRQPGYLLLLLGLMIMFLSERRRPH